MGIKKGIQQSPESRGHNGCGVAAVRHDTVMASRIDGPSHKWAISSVVSHDMAPICGVT